MPSEKELDQYYSEFYWTAFRGKGRDCLLRHRDVHHWREILELFGGAAPASLFNFGAGHGGVSLLAAAAGARVVNFDPGNRVDFPGIENAEGLSSTRGQFDLVYSSHSIEHVREPDETMNALVSLLKPGPCVSTSLPTAPDRFYL